MAVVYRDIYDRVVAGRAYRLPDNTSRVYLDDGTYINRAGILVPMLDDGYITLGPTVSPPESLGASWLQYRVTDKDPDT